MTEHLITEQQALELREWFARPEHSILPEPIVYTEIGSDLRGCVPMIHVASEMINGYRWDVFVPGALNRDLRN